jgi:hypothetical protein
VVFRTEADSDFAGALSRLLLACLTERPASFRSLVERMDGAFPADVRISLQRLIAEGKVIQRGEDCFLSTSSAVTNCPIEQPPPHAVDSLELPLPHPADYDWRFMSRTSRFLSKAAVRLAGGRPVGLFGAPTVYVELQRLEASVVLFERNAEMVRALPQTLASQVVESDLLGFAEIPSGSFGAIVADPPWYPEYYRAFLQHAANALADEGFLMLSLLPRLARPNASVERREILEHSTQLGFDLRGYHKGRLRYRTPPFERHSLETEGLDCGDWRRGDLIVLQLTHRTSTDEALLPLRTDEPIWDGFSVSGHQFKVRRRKSDTSGSFRFKPLGQDGPTLPTVSRRHIIRDRIDVWSELNDAWEVSRVDVIHALLKKLEAMEPVAIALSQVAAEYHLQGDDLNSVEQFLQELIGDENYHRHGHI